MKIRVLHTAWCVDKYQGAEMRIINEMEEMRHRGVFLALAARENAKILQKAREKGFETYVLPFKGKFDWKTIFQLRKILKAQSFDIINTHDSVDTWCGGLASIGSGTKFIRTRHILERINPSPLNFINSLADFILAAGEKVREQMIQENRIDPKRILSVPTGIDINVFDKQNYDKAQMRARYGIPENAFVVGNLSALRQSKQQDLFIAIAQAIGQKYENFSFIIGGGGEEYANLEALAKEANHSLGREAVRLLGHIEQPAEFLSTLDFFLLTNRGDGVPQSLSQALLMEIPSIAPDTGSIADLHRKENGHENFILVSNPSKEEFIKALESLINQTTTLMPNRQFMVENFSLSAMGEKILSIYHHLLHRS